MKIIFLTLVMLALTTVAGYAEECNVQAPAENMQASGQSAQQVIDQSKTMGTVAEQTAFLVGQANSFMDSKNFEQANQTAQYILSSLDANSQEAKSILDASAAGLNQAAE